MTLKEYKVQHALGTDTADLKRKVAQDSSSSADLLTFLSKDPSMFIRSYVAANCNVPEEVLSILAFDVSLQGLTHGHR